MNVLSLFDGMSCGQIALERAGIKVDKYFASEIDKYAIKVTQSNYPNTIQLGDITKINGKDLPKIDILMGGSPCQGFSFAGKQLNFNDPRSKLFFEFVRLLKETKPKYFLLENVKMKKEFQNKISELMGVEPILINSALVSAQNRKRLYWTNIPNIKQPKDKKIYLKDILEKQPNYEVNLLRKKSKIVRVSGRNSPVGSKQEWDNIYKNKSYQIVDKDKSYCIDSNYFKGGNLKQYFNKKRRQLIFQLPHGVNKGGIKAKNGKTPSMRQYNNLLIQTGIANLKGFDIIKRTYDINGKCPTLTTMTGGHREPKITTSKLTWRKLTPLECERLQTVPDNYTLGVSDSQRYKMLGNGWTVDVIAHIFKSIDNTKNYKQK